MRSEEQDFIFEVITDLLNNIEMCDALLIHDEERSKLRNIVDETVKNAEKVNSIVEKVLEDAEQRRILAGHAGDKGDGGCNVIKERVKFYLYGKMGMMPQEWEHYLAKLDPEYQTYLRLKKKFD